MMVSFFPWKLANVVHAETMLHKNGRTIVPSQPPVRQQRPRNQPGPHDQRRHDQQDDIARD